MKGGALKLQMGANLASQDFQAFALRSSEGAGFGVEDADGPENLVIVASDWDSGEETEIGDTRHEGAGGKSGITAEVADFEGASLGHGVRIKGEVEIERLAALTEIIGKAPALLVTRANEADWGLAEGRSKLSDVVEIGLNVAG